MERQIRWLLGAIMWQVHHMLCMKVKSSSFTLAKEKKSGGSNFQGKCYAVVTNSVVHKSVKNGFLLNMNV